MSNIQVVVLMFCIWLSVWVVLIILVAAKVIWLPWQPKKYPDPSTTVLLLWPVSIPILVVYQLIMKLVRRCN